MRTYYFLILAAIITLTSCNSNHKKADAYGNFEAIEVIVSAEANGQIISLNVEEGSVLLKSKVVGLIDTTMLSLNRKLLRKQKETVASQFANLDAEINVSKQQLANTRINEERIHNLYNAGAATKKQLDDIEGAVKLVQKQIAALKTKQKNISDQIESIEVQIMQVEESLRKCRIINPVEGTVLVKYSEPGEMAAIGKPLYKIANLEQMKLKAYVTGAQLPNIKIGQKVEVLFDKNNSENTSTEGVISWISQSAEFTPKTIQTKQERVNLVYAIKVSVKNDGVIKIGMPGEVNF